MDKKNRRVGCSSFFKTSFDGIAANRLVPDCANPPADDATLSAQEQPRAIAFFTRQDFSGLQALAERVFPKDATSPGSVMGSGPHTSVVNPWLQVCDYGNVFVVGASALPQNAGFNPTATVGALAFRAADALVDRWFRKPGTLA